MVSSKIKIGLADDQQLFVKGLSSLIDSFEKFEVVVDALNGADLLSRLSLMQAPPEILLIDVNMPVMDGLETVKEVAVRFPLIKMVALSMRDDDNTIINMIKAGCCSYLLKDIHPGELEKALHEISATGYYNGDTYNINYRRLLHHEKMEASTVYSDMEIAFLGLAASDLTYRQIASKLHRSERTIDGYREALFDKLNVQSRVGMVLEGLRKKLIAFDAIVK